MVSPDRCAVKSAAVLTSELSLASQAAFQQSSDLFLKPRCPSLATVSFCAFTKSPLYSSPAKPPRRAVGYPSELEKRQTASTAATSSCRSGANNGLRRNCLLHAGPAQRSCQHQKENTASTMNDTPQTVRSRLHRQRLQAGITIVAKTAAQCARWLQV
jgi:hypothetical protein